MRAKNIAVLVATVVLVVLALEVACRLLGVDFGGEKAFSRYPIYYRQPIVPTGEAYFRRPGPAEWRGKVLQTGLAVLRGADIAYLDEKEVTVSYDNDGFRNPDNLTDWEVVVVGDSFVESGYLAYDDLFTTRLGGHLGVRVKNLGLSFTGPLSYCSLLKSYGTSRSTKHAVMVFFEGNDIDDLEREHRDLDTFRRTGKREYRTLKQTSFLKTLAYYLRGPKSRGKRLFQNSFFTTPAGDIPFTASYTPPAKEQLSRESRELLDAAIAEWSTLARGRGLTPWLVFMPANRRVFDGYLRFTENAKKEIVAWKPTDLPEFVGELGAKSGVGFIDVTPALAEETRKGRLTYNPILDTHLNALGSEIVARTVAEALQAHSRPSGEPALGSATADRSAAE